MGHLEREGFSVKTVNISYDELNALKVKNEVPRRLWSCHTGFVSGYIIEGHVPGDIVLRFLKEKPAAAGIGVPGMPTGSPGMEGPNARPYGVFTFDKSGKTRFYAQVKP
ncbi:DUF411 domain-containing protein [Nitrospinota bacterium]